VSDASIDCHGTIAAAYKRAGSAAQYDANQSL
jgi:hypothetical protein